MKQQKSTISIDWLQCLCTKNNQNVDTQSWFTSPQLNEFGNHNTYVLVDAKEFTMGYNFHKSVMLGKICVAHLSWSPKRENVEPTNASIKIANNVLYTNMWHFLLGDICKAIGWQVKAITRIDIACDLNFFLHGLRPEVFIRKYLRGRNSSYIRCGSNKFSVVGEKYEKSTRIDYIRWGSRSSGVCTYLYNKSKEMREQSTKPWIIERWKGAGLDVKNVWRLEFSINSSGRGLKDIETGLIHTLFVDDVESQQQLISIFQTYALRYFHFKQYTYGTHKYVKNMKDFQLIDLSQATALIPTTLYQSTHKSNALSKCLEVITEIEDELTNKTDKSSQQDKASLHCTWFLVNRKLQEQKELEHKTELLEQDIATRLLRNIGLQTAQKSILRANSYINDQTYKEEICKRTAQRITALLISRKNSKICAYSA